eukprot:7883915-Pyramimonas_sp.AAC.1
MAPPASSLQVPPPLKNFRHRRKKTAKQARAWTITLRPTTAVALHPPSSSNAKVKSPIRMG